MPLASVVLFVVHWSLCIFSLIAAECFPTGTGAVGAADCFSASRLIGLIIFRHPILWPCVFWESLGASECFPGSFVVQPCVFRHPILLPSVLRQSLMQPSVFPAILYCCHVFFLAILCCYWVFFRRCYISHIGPFCIMIDLYLGGCCSHLCCLLGVDVVPTYGASCICFFLQKQSFSWACTLQL